MSERRQVIAIAITSSAVLALFVGYAIYAQFRMAIETAEQSALAALVQEIHDQLAAIPPGGEYPESLADLPLSYPDGGDAELLKRIEYHRTEVGCYLRSRIFERDVEYTFPMEKSD
jgi:hypothetical protein